MQIGVETKSGPNLLEDPRAALLEDYPDVESWWDRYLGGQMRMVSPRLDGTDLQLSFEAPFDVIKKTLSASGSAFNALFSYLLLTQIVQEANTYGVLPKVPWRGPRTVGWRVKTAAAVASGVGIAESGTVPADADATYVTVTPTIGEYTHAWGMSKRLVDSVTIADTIRWNQDVEQHTLDFFKAFNTDLWAALATVEAPNVESLRNLLSSNGEKVAKSLASNVIDPWLSVDRDAAASWADANCLYGASGTDRDLSVALIDGLREGQEPYWEGPNKLDNKVYITGYNTHGRWSRLEAAKQRYGTDFVELSIGGIKSSGGQKTGFKVASWDTMTAIRESNMSTETIADLALIDLNHWYLAQLRPFEMADEENPFITGFRRRALWYGSGQVVVEQFKGSGILTDLK